MQPTRRSPREITGSASCVPITSGALERLVLSAPAAPRSIHFVPKADATAVSRLLAAGGIIWETKCAGTRGRAERTLCLRADHTPATLPHAGRQQLGEARDYCRRRFATCLGPTPEHIRIRAHSCGLAAIADSGRVRDRTISAAIGRAQPVFSRQSDCARSRTCFGVPLSSVPPTSITLSGNAARRSYRWVT